MSRIVNIGIWTSKIVLQNFMPLMGLGLSGFAVGFLSYEIRNNTFLLLFLGVVSLIFVGWFLLSSWFYLREGESRQKKSLVLTSKHIEESPNLSQQETPSVNMVVLQRENELLGNQLEKYRKRSDEMALFFKNFISTYIENLEEKSRSVESQSQRLDDLDRKLKVIKYACQNLHFYREKNENKHTELSQKMAHVSRELGEHLGETPMPKVGNWAQSLNAGLRSIDGNASVFSQMDQCIEKIKFEAQEMRELIEEDRKSLNEDDNQEFAQFLTDLQSQMEDRWPKRKTI